MRNKERAQKIIELAKKEGKQEIYAGVYVETGEDLLNDLLEGKDNIVPEEIYIYDDGGNIFETFDEWFDFPEEEEE